ncbi:MAG: alpha/beta fold hydrolase, partial [Gemmatimonadetes bacterium]|nr:alpha/beta fold hydrolase [Gemmatimonadota bacterium]
VLLLHGAGGGPADMRELGAGLAEDGHDVLCPLLPGHGLDELTLATSRFSEYLDRARRAFDTLSAGGRPVFLVAQSMGAVLAVRLITERPADPRPVAGFAALAPAFFPFVARRMGLFAAGLVVKTQLAVATFQWQVDLLREISATRKEIGRVQCPLLVFISDDDASVSPRGARLLHDEAGSAHKGIHELTGQGHVLSVAPDRERLIFEPTRRFLQSPGGA